MPLSTIVDEWEFPIIEGGPNSKRSPYPYLTYQHWNLHPALRGVGEADLNDCFCAHFLLSIEDVHTLCWMVHKRLEPHPVELDNIGFVRAAVVLT